MAQRSEEESSMEKESITSRVSLPYLTFTTFKYRLLLVFRYEGYRGVDFGCLCRCDTGKTAIRTLTGPAYQKLKKAPEVKDDEEAKVLLQKVLPQ